MQTETRNIGEIVFREDLYPRFKGDPLLVQKYAADLDVLPPIEINQHNELIDGWHRWTAHKKQERTTIQVVVTQTSSDSHALELAILRNAIHGLQLSQEDKQNMARKIYNATPERERAAKKAQLCSILSVSQRTVYDWLSRIDKDAKEQRDRRIFAKWLACWTQDEIAESEGITHGPLVSILSDFADLQNQTKSAKTLATYSEPEWTAPIYNVWKQQEKSSGSKHFGNSEVRWLDNLLYLYTEPFDVVVDPFAGGGSTIDLCTRRSRRYYVSDRKPIIERSSDIRLHDLITGDSITLPSVPRWKDVSLVYLDPPYWRQALNQYSEDPTDLANVPLDIFNKHLSSIVKAFGAKLKASAREKPSYIALIIQPTQWSADERRFTDHVGDMLRRVSLPVHMRFSVPYESQQYNAQQVNWAKDNRRCLVLTREIVVWEVGNAA